MFMPLDIRNQEMDELLTFVGKQGEQAFRARQIHEWLWKKRAGSFIQMSNLPRKLLESLEKEYVIQGLKISAEQISRDKTRKIGFTTFDNRLVEGVLIPAGRRVTACISSQIGCPLNCSFCATARLKDSRDLSAGEIFDQVHLLQEKALNAYDTKISNLVFMGMGEPLLNYDHVLRAVFYITSDEGLGFSARRLTLSTVGLTDGIRKLGQDRVRFNLAVSLHAASQDKRIRIMPVSKSNPLDDLADAIRYFYDRTGTRITYEYLLIKDFNDTPEDARKLAEFCRITPCKVNLIEYNQLEGLPYQRTTRERLNAFYRFLESRNMVVSMRRSRGLDISAACGQLAGRFDQK